MPRTRTFARWIWTASLAFLTLSGCDDGQPRTTGRADGAGAEAAVQTAAARSGPGGGGFTGVFHATGDGTRSVLNLTERGGRLTGMLDAANITGEVDGARARGDVKDAATAARLGTVDLTLAGDTVELKLSALDPRSGAAFELPPARYARGVPPPIDVQLDAQLAGRWRHAWGGGEAGAGADATTAAETWLVLNPDGSVQYGKSKSSLGDASGIPITEEDGGFAGKWRTTDRTLHVMPDGHARWAPYAQYQIDGDKLLLTFNDGSRQVYSRN